MCTSRQIKYFIIEGNLSRLRQVANQANSKRQKMELTTISMYHKIPSVTLTLQIALLSKCVGEGNNKKGLQRDLNLHSFNHMLSKVHTAEQGTFGCVQTSFEWKG